MGNKAVQKKRFIFSATISQISFLSYKSKGKIFFKKNLNVPELKYKKIPNYRKMV